MPLLDVCVLTAESCERARAIPGIAYMRLRSPIDKDSIEAILSTPRLTGGWMRICCSALASAASIWTGSRAAGPWWPGGGSSDTKLMMRHGRSTATSEERDPLTAILRL